MDNKNNAYAAINGYQQKDNYGQSDPYAGKQDPYKKNSAGANIKEKKRLWELDFEILRFFRENYNAGIDFEESPRAFFDEEFMFSLRMRLLKRNFSTITIKFLIMLFFSLITLFMSVKFTIIAGAIYLVSFLYFIAVPMGFVKYSRQYVANNEVNGKLNNLHKTYAGWVKPLEVIAMNTFTVIFVSLQILMIFNLQVLHGYIQRVSEQYISRFEKLQTHISSLTISDMQNSILVAGAFYLVSYLLYWVIVYKLLKPKWEAVREENEKAYRRTNQRTARNLQDELTGV